MTQTSSPRAQLTPDAYLVSAITESVESTLRDLCGVEVGKPSYRWTASFEMNGDLSGKIWLTQHSQELALFVVSFPKALILALMEKIYGAPFPELNSRVEAGVAELTNVAFGGLKTRLNTWGPHRFVMTLPKVIRNEDCGSFGFEARQSLVVDFPVIDQILRCSILWKDEAPPSP